MGRLVALGDSFSCGEGVGLHLSPDQTWVAILADSLDVHPLQLATAGATVADVWRTQLPLALASGGGEFASVMAGLNDVFKRTFEPAAMRSYLVEIVTELASCFDTVLVGRWHDPLTQFTIPRWLRQGILMRVAAINAAVDAAALAARRCPGQVVVVDLATEQNLLLRQAWAVDRVHPSECGHQLIAHAAGRAVAASVLGAPAITADGVPSLLAEGQWLALHGAPWILRRLGRIAVPVAAMAIRGRDQRFPETAIDDGAAELMPPGQQPGACGDIACV